MRGKDLSPGPAELLFYANVGNPQLVDLFEDEIEGARMRNIAQNAVHSLSPKDLVTFTDLCIRGITSDPPLWTESRKQATVTLLSYVPLQHMPQIVVETLYDKRFSNIPANSDDSHPVEQARRVLKSHAGSKSGLVVKDKKTHNVITIPVHGERHQTTTIDVSMPPLEPDGTVFEATLIVPNELSVKDRQIIQLVTSGASRSQIAEETGFVIRSVYQSIARLRRAGLLPGDVHGEQPEKAIHPEITTLREKLPTLSRTERREAIAALLTVIPTTTVSELIRHLDISRATFYRDLDKIQQTGVLDESAINAVLKPNALKPDEQLTPRQAAVLALLEKDPTSSRIGIAQVLGVSQPTIRHEFIVLDQLGLRPPVPATPLKKNAKYTKSVAPRLEWVKTILEIDPDITPTKLATSLGVSVSTAARDLRRLKR